MENKLIKSRFVSAKLKKLNSTLYYFVRQINKIEGSDKIHSIQSLGNKVRRVGKRIYTLDISICEHKIYQNRINRLYISLKRNGLFDMDNEQLFKFPFERMKITKAGTISFNQ